MEGALEALECSDEIALPLGDPGVPPGSARTRNERHQVPGAEHCLHELPHRALRRTGRDRVHVNVVEHDHEGALRTGALLGVRREEGRNGRRRGRRLRDDDRLEARHGAPAPLVDDGEIVGGEALDRVAGFVQDDHVHGHDLGGCREGGGLTLRIGLGRGAPRSDTSEAEGRNDGCQKGLCGTTNSRRERSRGQAIPARRTSLTLLHVPDTAQKERGSIFDLPRESGERIIHTNV